MATVDFQHFLNFCMELQERPLRTGSEGDLFYLRVDEDGFVYTSGSSSEESRVPSRSIQLFLEHYSETASQKLEDYANLINTPAYGLELLRRYGAHLPRCQGHLRWPRTIFDHYGDTVPRGSS